jgi:type VI secretion system secreted protein VgrG
MHRFQVDGLSHTLRVTRFEGHEGLSDLFHFEVDLACEEKDIALADAIGRDATLTIDTGGEPRLVHGVVDHFEQGGDGRAFTSYRACIVPRVSRLLHRHASRIFQELTTPEIIVKTLTVARIAPSSFRLALRGGYRPREYCVQYRETDWAFLCRLMEEEGIGYYFEHADGQHVLVMSDGPSAHAPIQGDAAVVYRPPTGALVTGDHVSYFRFAEKARPGKVILRDYNFKKPELSLEASASVAADDDLEVYDYPGDYDAPGPANDTARVRLEQLQVSRSTGEGEGACARLSAGYTFKLSEHPRDDFNAEYLVLRVEHRGVEPPQHGTPGEHPPTYENRFEVIPSHVPFRPLAVTPWPRVTGVQTAIVVGPAGEEIYTDEHGRVKVQFHWDRSGKRDERSSCWIRVSQIWSGPAWGAMFIPRVGHEVVVDFIEGDPDRPLIVGSVYHGTNVPPYPLPADKTRSTIKTNSSTKGNGFNEIRFEDKKGSEEVYLRGEKDWTIEIQNDKQQTIGRDESLDVGHDRSKVIGRDQSEEIGGKKTTKVALSHTESIGEDESVEVGKKRSVKVGLDDALDVAGGQTWTIGKGMALSVKDGMAESVGKSRSETVGGDKSSEVGGTYDVAVGKAMKLTIEKDSDTEVKENMTLLVGKKLTVECGGSVISIDKDGKITVQGADITVKSDGPVKVEGKKIDVKSEGPVNLQASGNVKVKGGKVGLN